MVRSKSEMADIVQASIEKLRNGQENLETVLSSSPDQSEEIKAELEAAVWLYQRSQILDSRPGFLPASRRRLVSQIQQEAKGGQPRRLATPTGFFANLWNDAYIFQTVATLIFVVAVFFGSSSIAMAAENTLPGDALYGVKRAQEQVQLWVTFTREGDARLYAEFSQHRLVELQMLVLEGKLEWVGSTVVDYEESLNIAQALVSQVAVYNDQAAGVLARELDDLFVHHTEVLAELAVNVPEAARVHIDHALLMSSEHIREDKEPAGPKQDKPGDQPGVGGGDPSKTGEPAGTPAGDKPITPPGQDQTDEPKENPGQLKKTEPAPTEQPSATDHPGKPDDPGENGNGNDNPDKPTKEPKPVKQPKPGNDK